MKFIINSLLFSKQISAISGVVSNNNTVPIVNCFHFHLDEGLLTIRATDLETTLVTKIEVETGALSGLTDIAVPAKLLLDIIKNLDDVPLTFSVDDSNFSITISSGEGKYSMAGKNAETFPSMPEARETSTIIMPSSVLVNAISMTTFAASTDEMRPQMCGIFCEINEESTTFVATDAHKLVRYRRHDIKSDQPVSFILPRKPVSMLKSILAGYKEDVEVTVEYNHVNAFFSFDNAYIICRLVDGKYPNYDAAIPKENPNKLTIERSSFHSTLRRVGLFANQASHQIRLSMQAHELEVSAEDLEFSNDASEKLPCSFDGEPMEIGFNAKFLTEMVQNLGTEHIMIEMSHPSRAGIITPVIDEPDTPEDILMLVMPVMLGN
ncbi:MAG: DNA polymerase III subunit beta [Bacteroidales bacterium]|nr:DNA polymerase III subunit beta [Bacteroidales bacterium]